MAKRTKATKVTSVVPFKPVDHKHNKPSHEEMLEQLSEMSELEYERDRAKLAKKWGVRRGFLDRLFKLSRVRWEYEQAKRAKPTGPNPADLEQRLRPILETEGILDLWIEDWDKVMAGEHRNAKLLYLVATSRLFDKCMSVAVKGVSSGGKSEVRKTVLEFFPPEDVVNFVTLSEKALLYHDGDFTHKILSMGEACGGKEWELQDMLLRELISEGKLIYPVAQKINGQIVTTYVTKNGPVVFMVTTTKASLNPENETRMISIEIDDSEQQTRKVLGKQAWTLGKNRKPGDDLYRDWVDFQRLLRVLGDKRGGWKVTVPFAGELAELIPPRATRLRRDFPQLLSCIKAHALIHCYLRQTNKSGEIVADRDLDYGPVRELLAHVTAEGAGIAVSDELKETLDAVRILTADPNMPPDDGATAFEVGKRLKLDKSTALRRLRVAMDKGFVVNLQQRRGQPGRYRLTEQDIEVEELLPTADQVRAMEAQ
jgi:hypothetical protein